MAYKMIPDPAAHGWSVSTADRGHVGSVVQSEDGSYSAIVLPAYVSEPFSTPEAAAEHLAQRPWTQQEIDYHRS